MNKFDNKLQRRPDWAALLIAVGLAVIGAVLLWDAGRLNEAAGYAGVGPASMPRVVGAGLLILAVWCGVSAWRGDFPERDKQDLGPVFWIVAGLAAQLLLLKVAGFSVATGLLFAFTARAFGQRNLAFSIPFGIVFAFAIWLVFAQLLMLSLPPGPLEHLFFPGAK